MNSDMAAGRRGRSGGNSEAVGPGAGHKAALAVGAHVWRPACAARQSGGICSAGTGRYGRTGAFTLLEKCTFVHGTRTDEENPGKPSLEGMVTSCTASGTVLDALPALALWRVAPCRGTHSQIKCCAYSRWRSPKWASQPQGMLKLR